MTITLKPLHIALIAFAFGVVVTVVLMLALTSGSKSTAPASSGAGAQLEVSPTQTPQPPLAATPPPSPSTSPEPSRTPPPAESPTPTPTPPPPTPPPPPTTTVISFTGTGGPVPDGDADGASFEIMVSDPRLIAATGNNVTLTLVGIDTTTKALADEYTGFGGLVDFTVTLEHVGQGGPQFAFDRVLNPETFICMAALNGTYTFRSGEPITLQGKCGTGNVQAQESQSRLIPPGTYLTTAPNDTADSNLSAFWNGQPVAGTWRLHVIDRNVNTGSGLFTMNTDWTWRLDIEVRNP